MRLKVHAVMTRDLKDEIKQHDEEMIATVRAKRGCARRYRQDRKKQIKAVVSEVYSHPGITAVSKLLPELSEIPGFCVRPRHFRR